MVQPSLISPIYVNVTKPRLAGRTKIVWFLFAKLLLAFIVVIRYEEHDKDGGSTIKVYTTNTNTFFIHHRHSDC